MKAVKIAAIVLLVYVAIVAVFELSIGILQPQSESTLIITTTNEMGTANDRVLSRIELEGQVYVAANHWPRAWYNEVLETPSVRVTIDGVERDYLAVPVEGEEHERLAAARPLGFAMRALMGFPPRRFVRLDPA